MPFIEHTANYLARQEEGPSQLHWWDRTWNCGRAKEQGAAVEVLDPKGARALTLEEATRAQNMPLAMAGFYDVKRPNGRHELVAVNADRHESDLDVIPEDTAGVVAEYGSGAGTQRNRRRGSDSAASPWSSGGMC